MIIIIPEMLIEIEQTVVFLTSFLYGTIPRRRIDTFAEILANRLLEQLMDQSRPPKICHLVVNVAGKSDPLIQDVAEEAYLDLTEIQSLLPNNLIVEIRQGSVNAVNADTGQTKAIYPESKALLLKTQDNGRYLRNRYALSPNWKSRNGEETKRRPVLRIEYEYRCSTGENKCGRPYFELQRDDAVYTAQAFAATRFGSTKLKSHQGVDAGNGYHPYTTPSLYAYLQLLIFLNALACLTVWSEKLEKELDNMKDYLNFRKLICVREKTTSMYHLKKIYERKNNFLFEKVNGKLNVTLCIYKNHTIYNNYNKLH
uniref:Anti_prolifrtn domain-containing protein n=1 Tax=Elaeophora elaphi TaxID=1147741 RepID=A0A0R3RHZ2_9BILA